MFCHQTLLIQRSTSIAKKFYKTLSSVQMYLLRWRHRLFYGLIAERTYNLKT